jgi:hypothetical protein
MFATARLLRCVLVLVRFHRCFSRFETFRVSLLDELAEPLSRVILPIALLRAAPTTPSYRLLSPGPSFTTAATTTQTLGVECQMLVTAP